MLGTKIISFFLCCFLTSSCFSSKLPSTFKKCDRNGTDFNECMSEAVEDAIKQLTQPIKKYGLPNLEPLHIESIEIGASSGGLSFDQNLTYLNVYGLTKMNVKKFDIDFRTNVVQMECFFPQAKYEFEYAFNGSFLAVPLNVNGIGTVIFEKHSINVTFYLEKYARKEKLYYKVTDQKLTLGAKKITIKMEVHNEDKSFEDQMNKLFNENWKALLHPGKGPYETVLGKVVGAIFNNLLRKVPISELFGN